MNITIRPKIKTHQHDCPIYYGWLTGHDVIVEIDFSEFTVAAMHVFDGHGVVHILAVGDSLPTSDPVTGIPPIVFETEAFSDSVNHNVKPYSPSLEANTTITR